MRLRSIIFRPLARLSAFLAAKAVLILGVIAFSLSFSMASFVVPALASAMWGAAAKVFGPPAVATVTETQRLRQQNQAVQRSNRELHRTNRQQAQANRVLSTENQRLITNNNRLSGQLSGHRQVTASTASRIGQRAVRMSTRSIAAIPLESVPILGVTTIIATTAWEIRDTCATLDDMDEIQRQIGQEPNKSFASRVCENMPLQGARVDHYGNKSVSECRADAETARDQVFELADQARDAVPDLAVDDNDFDAEIIQAANEEFEAINVICDCIADLLCNPQDLAQR